MYTRRALFGVKICAKSRGILPVHHAAGASFSDRRIWYPLYGILLQLEHSGMGRDTIDAGFDESHIDEVV